MVHSTEILQNIKILPLEQRISIIESLLQSVKSDVFKAIEQKQTSNIHLVYQILMLSNESNALQSLFRQTSTNELPVKKGDKTLNPTELFGMWADKPRNLQDIRKNDWQRNWNI